MTINVLPVCSGDVIKWTRSIAIRLFAENLVSRVLNVHLVVEMTIIIVIIGKKPLRPFRLFTICIDC